MVFLKDRLPWIGLVMGVFALLFFYQRLVAFYDPDLIGWMSEFPYLFIVVSVLLAVFLMIEYGRYRSYYETVEKLAHLKSLENWGWRRGPGQEGKMVGEAIDNLQKLMDQEMEALKERERQHQEFIEVWVHQMKTPVSALSLMAQQAKGLADREDRIAMEEEVERLNQGLELILHLARLRSFAIDVQLKPTPLIQTIRDLINENKRRLIHHRIFPKLVCEEDEVLVYTDPKWNRFVLDQLLQNAIKYMILSQRQGTIEWTVTRKPDRILLTLRDEGPGIPDHDVPRVFHPFFTGENGRIYPQSTGMGLYLVRKVTDLLGHRVMIDSVWGKGTVAKVEYLLDGVSHVDRYRQFPLAHKERNG